MKKFSFCLRSLYGFAALSLIASLMICTLGVNAQAPGENTVHGKVLDENGKGLDGATVTVKGSTKATQTDNTGAFTLSDIKRGTALVISF